MKEDALLVCMLTEEMQGEPVEGSIAMTCDECGAGILVAPSSLELLRSGDPVLLLCTRCSLKDARQAKAVTGHERKIRQIERMREKAEEAYDRMYDARSDYAAKWEYEFACDLLRGAARLAREIERPDDALMLEKRAEHIRKVYRHQFMYPPDLLN